MSVSAPARPRPLHARRRFDDHRTVQLAALVAQSHDAIILKSTTGLIEDWNAGAERMYGYRSDEILGQPISILVPSSRRGEEKEILRRVFGGETVTLETERRRKDGSLIDISLVVSPLQDHVGAVVAVSAIARDITARKQLEAELRFRADHDPLTGLANRRVFEEQLASQMAHAKRYGGGGAVLMLDIDHFKAVNDTLGHRAGDELIKTLASALRERARRTDTLARLGGDEFAVLMPKATRAQAVRFAAALVDAVRARLAMKPGDPPRVTTSVGVALIDGTADNLDAVALLSEADEAMYRAKREGGDRYALGPERRSACETPLA